MNRSFRALRLALLLCACLCAHVSPASAQSDTGEIIITVVDANSKSPLVDARTILIGPQTASSLTTKAGVIHYTDVPTGIYRVRVVKRGFDSGASKEFDVLEGRSVSVRVELSTSTGGLKIIGSVTARSNVSVRTSDINDNSPIRRISNSLTDALDTIAGVTVTQDATDPTSPVTVSLTNHDESQTAITLDGIPLSAPGTSANLRGIGTDLFSGSSVSNSPSAGALGGGVNFRTLEPTQAFQLHGLGTTGTFDRSNYSVAATGSVDSLGFAIQHTWRGSNSPLTFQDYEDQSGLTYPHEGESTSLGDYVKFRYRLNDDRTSISGTALSNNLDATAVCARDVTILPCGIGPGNQNYGRFGFGYATVQSLIGTVATTFSGYTSSSRQTTDDANRYVLEPPCDISIIGQTACDPGDSGYEEDLFPSLTTNDTLTRGIAYSSSISQGRHSLTLGGNTYASIASSVPIAGSKFEVPFTTAISSTSYTFSDSFKSSDKLTLQPRVSVVNTTTLGTSALAGFGATWAPSAADSFTSSINVGSSQPNININRSYSDPVSARFDCEAKTAVVSGPGDTNGGSQSAVSLDAAWTHRFASGSTVTADLFSQVQTGQLITAAIEEPASYYASEPGYLTDLTAAYRSPSVCGAGGGVPTVYAQESVGGTRRIYQGINLTGRFGLGRYVVALPSYSLNKAELTAASSRLDDGPSTTVVGAQLPNRPLHRAGMTIDGFLPRSGIELIGNAQYTGANNQQNIGPYVTVAAGISHQFGPGQATLFENNIFNTYGGDFASDSFAAPLPLSNGAIFHTAGTPLVPRTINLSYAVNLGGPRPGPAIASVRNLAQARPEPSPSPSASEAPRRNRFVPVPPPPGVDPLSLASSRPECDATQQTAAKPLFDALRAYVTAYEAKAKLPDVAGFTIVPQVASADPTVPYYLELRPRRPQGSANRSGAGNDATGFPRAGRFGGGGGGERQTGGGVPGGGGGGGGPEGPPPGEGAAPGGNAPGGEASGGAGGAPTDAQRAANRNSPQALAFRAFTSCAYVSVFTADEAKAKGIVPQGGRPGLFYVPKTGLTFVRPPELPQGGGSLKR